MYILLLNKIIFIFMSCLLKNNIHKSDFNKTSKLRSKTYPES